MLLQPLLVALSAIATVTASVIDGGTASTGEAAMVIAIAPSVTVFIGYEDHGEVFQSPFDAYLTFSHRELFLSAVEPTKSASSPSITHDKPQLPVPNVDSVKNDSNHIRQRAAAGSQVPVTMFMPRGNQHSPLVSFPVPGPIPTTTPHYPTDFSSDQNLLSSLRSSAERIYLEQSQLRSLEKASRSASGSLVSLSIAQKTELTNYKTATSELDKARGKFPKTKHSSGGASTAALSNSAWWLAPAVCFAVLAFVL